MRRHRAFAAAAFVAAVCWAARGGAVQYTVDPAHTSVTFQVRHLFTKVTGRFDAFTGTITFDPADPEHATVQGSIDAASVSTNNAQRDKDLRSENFFDVAKFPRISFVTSGVSAVDPAKQSGKMEGRLTIHGVERPVILDVAYLGAGTDPWGKQRAGFSAATVIDRKDFGLTWNKALEAGGVLVGDEISIDIQVEATAADH